MKIGDYVDSVYSGIVYEVIGLNIGWVKVQCIYDRDLIRNTHARFLVTHTDFFDPDWDPDDYAEINRGKGGSQKGSDVVNFNSNAFLQPAYEKFIKNAILAGVLQIPKSIDMRTLLTPAWIDPPAVWIDPKIETASDEN